MFWKRRFRVAGVFIPLVLLLLGAAGGPPVGMAQTERGSVAVGPYVLDQATDGGPFLADVCVELSGEGYDETACSSDVLQASALFTGVPFGSYALSLVSAPAACSTADLPVTVDVTSTKRVYVNIAMVCESTTLTVHVAECATETAGDLFAACHENHLAGVNLLIDSVMATSDADGVATAPVTAGSTSLREFPVPAGYVGVYGYCSDQADDATLFDGDATDGLTFDAPAADEVVCDLYNLVAATGDVAAGDDGAAGPTVLPTTGIGTRGEIGGGLPLYAIVLPVLLAGAAFSLRRFSIRISSDGAGTGESGRD